MKKYYFLIIVALILGLVLTGCSLLSNISQVPATNQSGVAYLTKGWPSSLVGLWHFDEESGAIASDSSGNGNNGDLMGDISWTSGKFGYALSLDGTEDYVSVADSTSLGITTELTIEAWVRTGVYTSENTRMMQIVDKGEHVNSKAYMLMISGNNLYGRVNKNTGTACFSPYPNDGEWHHVAYTFKSGEQGLYIDGINVASNAGDATIATNALPLLIGRGVDRPQYCWNGLIDEVRIWNVALTQDQLGKVYDFDGFFRPIDNPGDSNDVVNVAKAGRAIPVKFSLNGDQGVNIFAEGYPLSISIACDLGSIGVDEITTLTAGESSLNYDANADQYIYVWKTDESWAGTCRRLEVKLKDGQSYYANFQFK